VKQDSSGRYFEEYSWSDRIVNGHAVQLYPTSAGFHQDVSLAPDFRLAVPNLQGVHPALIGPITELLTFDADTQLAMRQAQLAHAGDRVYVGHGKPNSWADGTRVLLGEDAIDFDITFEAWDAPNGTARVTVRHVPPKMPEIKLPVGWMRAPIVTGAANNWVQVSQKDQGYIASVGEETFDVRITLSLADGRILLAMMENPVEVMERECADTALADCGLSKRYRISRKVRMDLQP
jgi:hypothetical protein